MLNRIKYPGFSKAEGIYLKAYEPYLSNKERADMSIPIKIEDREYRHLFSKMPKDPLYSKLIVLYNNGDVVTNVDEVRRCVYSVFGLTLFQEPDSQFEFDIRQGDPDHRRVEIEGLTKLSHQQPNPFDESEQEVISQHLKYFKGLENIGKPLKEVSAKLLDRKRFMERTDKITEEELLDTINLVEERTTHRNELERLLFFNGEYTREEAYRIFRKHKRSIRKVIGRNSYRRVVSEMRGAEKESPRIIQEASAIYGRSMQSKKRFSSFS
ncbi:hypothetical protein [Geomicrobium sp. JCM 19055]|uniref:hypothetical protein n=1 Tax=Geomicrobium sp. JCM 19055 TaxID=1460649 RepID=UPI00045ED191|nr:hypothetical protein [Geomicrobium sp. JCM 19055]GAJ98825.1 hypothetical protein JCM19055_1782 [Geomicrobium sp. JCM 19055]